MFNTNPILIIVKTTIQINYLDVPILVYYLLKDSSSTYRNTRFYREIEPIKIVT